MTRQVIVSTVPVLPEHQDAARDGLRQFVSAMRAEPGCLGFDLYASEASPGTFVTIAQWVDRDAYEAHRDAPAVQALMGSAAAMLSGAPTIDPLAAVDTVE